MNVNYGPYFGAGGVVRAVRRIGNNGSNYENAGSNFNNNYYLPNNVANRSLLNKMKNAFRRFRRPNIGHFGLTARIQAVLKTSMSPDEKIKAVKILLNGNKSRTTQNKLKLVTEALNSNFSRNANVRAAIINYLSSGNRNAAPPPPSNRRPNMGIGKAIGGLFGSRKTRFEEILASNRNSRSKAQELSFLLRSDPTNLNKKARLIGNAKNLSSNNRDDLFDLITSLREDQLENRRAKAMMLPRTRPGWTSSSSMFNSTVGMGGVGGSSSAPVGFQKQLPYTGNGGPIFGGARNERRVESSSGFGRNNGGLGLPRNNNGIPRNNGGLGLPRNNNGIPRNNNGGLGLPRNNNGIPRNNNGGLGIPRNNNGGIQIKYVGNGNGNGGKKKRCRPVKLKLLKGVVSDVNKKKLVSQVKKLGKPDAKKQKKDELVRFIIKRIRPPIPKKKKKRVLEPPVKENHGIIFKNTLQVNGTGNQGIRPPNVRNTPRNTGFIP